MKSRVSPPFLKDGQYSVVTADTDTGIILNFLAEYNIGSGDVFRTFDSLENAVLYCTNRIVENTKFECIIHDHDANLLDVLIQPKFEINKNALQHCIRMHSFLPSATTSYTERCAKYNKTIKSIY